MDEDRRARLERIMAGIAAGDRAMVVTLHAEFGGNVRAALLGIAGDIGLPGHAWRDADALDGLVWDACFELADVAGGWRPDGGALPWAWARHRLVTLLHRRAGPPTTALDDLDLDLDGEGPPAGPGADDPVASEVLAGLAARLPAAAVVQQALESCVTAADRELLLVHAQQVAGGDPSPAVTLARLYDLSPAAIRKRLQRARAGLARLVESDDRFAVLRSTTLLGPRRAA